MTPKYAPAREDGEKPYVVTVFNMGRLYEVIGWGSNASEARWDATGRPGPGRYALNLRRATPADMPDAP